MKTSLATEKKSKRVIEQLKDRRDYRARLIQRREDIDQKIKTVEASIRTLNEGVAA